ncbi:peptidylprolyl isomerase [Flavobacteriaceae bacterium F08102]|nr:peptidylprolyl isomerase [Flavobacteriaceae bacterium F08102]
MAILSKIRERSLFLIIIIALALFSFVIGDVFTRGGMGSNATSIGEINGENISREEFATLVEQQRTNFGNQGTQMQYVNNAWNTLLREKIYKNQLEKSGISLGEKAVWDELISQPFVQNSPQFKNQAGIFDEEIFKEYIASLSDAQNDNEQSKNAWLSWLEFERNVKSNLELRTYNNLINAGLGSTLKEGEQYYMDQNTKLNLEYVFVPFSSVPDSLVKVTDDEIRAYVKKHPSQFKSEASRNIKFVKFENTPTAEDEEAIKQSVAALIKDTVLYNKAAGSNMNVIGFRNTKNVEDFFRDHQSDTPLDNNYYHKNMVNSIIADTIFNMAIGEVYGPYKDDGYYKISKLVDIKQRPDSVQTRHILIPFAGAMRVDPSITRSKTDAKKVADSLFAIIKKDKSKFAKIAEENSSDVTSAVKGGDLGWIVSTTNFTPEYKDFAFDERKGTIDVIESPFGYHIIEIQDQRNIAKAVKIATFSTKIYASEETESVVYQNAESFTAAVENGKSFEEAAKENDLTVQPVVGLKAMDERVSTLNVQRQIVTWAFDKDTEEGDVKRFDVTNGYAVVKLDKAIKAGLNIGNSTSIVRQKLMNEKKSAIIREKMKANDLATIASENNVRVNSSQAVSLASPVLPGAGRAEELITTLVGLNENQLYKGIETPTGVFAVKITKKELPVALDNYSSAAKTVLNKYKAKSGKVFTVLKDLSDIEDNRASFY